MGRAGCRREPAETVAANTAPQHSATLCYRPPEAQPPLYTILHTILSCLPVYYVILAAFIPAGHGQITTVLNLPEVFFDSVFFLLSSGLL